MMDEDRERRVQEEAEQLYRAALWLRDDTGRGVERQYNRNGQRILPVCSGCAAARNARNSWAQVPEELWPAGSVRSHGICRDCWDAHYAPLLDGEPYPEP